MTKYEICHVQETRESLGKREGRARLICNRTLGHPGPHRHYRSDAYVEVEWHDKDTVDE